MKNVRVLDCTLRDGGRIIDCAFQNQEIKEISQRLADAKIDIIELGFLRDWRKVEYKGNSTFFTDVDQIRPFVNRNKKNIIYAAFVDFGMPDIRRYIREWKRSTDVVFTKEFRKYCLRNCMKMISRL